MHKACKDGEGMKISLLQQIPRFGYDPASAPELKFLKEQSELTLQDTFELLDEAGKRGSDLAVTIEGVNMHLHWADMRWPFPEVYEGLDGPLVKRFCECAKKWSMHIAAGLYLTIDQKTYNCAVLIDDEGTIIGVHKKIHLPAGEEYQVAHGDWIEVFDTKLGRIGLQVCWDMQFPETARIQALMGAELLVLPTWGWENIYGLCRAYENSVTIAAAMGLGFGYGLPKENDPSCVVDNMGRIIASGDREHAGVITCDVDIHKEPAPQYGSENYIHFNSMRQTRFSQRRPDCYGLLTQKLEQTPLYSRYEWEGKV